MPFRVPNIEDRIIVCGIGDLNLIVHGDGVKVGAVITAAHAQIREMEDFDFDAIVNYASAFHQLDRFSTLEEFKAALEKDMQIAESFINDMDKDEHLIIHCQAGIHRSPLFSLMFLLHLQGAQPNNDEAIRVMHNIAPANNCDSPEDTCRLYLGDNYQTLKDDLSAYWHAKAISTLSEPIFKDNLLTQFFDESVSALPRDDKERRLCKRFGFKPPAYLL